MDNLVHTSVCHGNQGSPTWRKGWRSDRHSGRSNHLQESRCCIVVRATYCCDGRGHHHWRVPTCTRYCSAVRTLSTCARHTVVTSRCSGRCWRRTASPHRRQAGTSNLLMHDDARATKAARSIGYVANQGCCPRWSRDRSTRGRRSRSRRKTSRIGKKN
jgi:hypothetical protein